MTTHHRRCVIGIHVTCIWKLCPSRIAGFGYGVIQLSHLLGRQHLILQKAIWLMA